MYRPVYISALSELLTLLGDISFTYIDEFAESRHVGGHCKQSIPRSCENNSSARCLSSIPLGRCNRNRFPMHETFVSLSPSSSSLSLSSPSPPRRRGFTHECTANASFYANYTWMRIMPDAPDTDNHAAANASRVSELPRRNVGRIPP